VTAVPDVDVAPRALVRNTGLNLVGQGLPLVVALVAVPILLRGLGEARFGVLGLVWMFVTLLGELGFGRAGTRFAAEALGAGLSAHVRRIARVTLLAQLGLGVLLGGFLALLSGALVGSVLTVDPALQEEARLSFLLLGATVPFLTVGAAYRGLLEAAQRFVAMNAVRFTVSTLNYLLPILVLALGGGLVHIVALLMALRLGATAGFAITSRPVWHPQAPMPEGSPPPPAPAEILGFGAWVTVSTVVSPVLVYLDRFLLGALVSVTAVGVYTAPYEVVTRILLVPASVATTLFPAVSAFRGMGGGDRVRRTSRKAAWGVLAMVGPVALLFWWLAGPLLTLWLGDAATAEMVTALRLLAPGVMANALAFVPFSVLQGLGRADVTGKIHLVELPVHAVVAWWLIGSYGVAGAAAAWSARAVLDAVLLFVAVRRVEPAP
jgi:O-antigen/teichoic acid export membrane protein